jgi:hypothetical protein
MTRPIPEAQDVRLRNLQTKRKQLDAQIKQTTRLRHRRQRQAARDRALVYGHLVHLAGLDGTAPTLLLGLLVEGFAPPVDATRQTQWHTVGAALLARDKRLQRTVARLWPALQAGAPDPRGS